MQIVLLTEIDQIQNIFLETRSAETDAGTQEFRTDTRIHTDRMGNFGDIRSGTFAKRGNAVD